MKKQVVLIHGGHAFDKNENFLQRLKDKKVSANNFKYIAHWTKSFPEKLGSKIETFTPLMPNKENSHYEEWKIWFEKIFPFINNGVILVGHSLGALFLVKYLSENNLPKKIKSLILIAGPYEGKNKKHTLNSNFIFSFENLNKVNKQVKIINILHSTDDEVVPFSDFKKYKEVFPKANFIKFENKGHFNQEEFPELVKLIKKL